MHIRKTTEIESVHFIRTHRENLCLSSFFREVSMSVLMSQNYTEQVETKQIKRRGCYLELTKFHVKGLRWGDFQLSETLQMQYHNYMDTLEMDCTA